MEEKYNFSEETQKINISERRTKTDIIRYEYSRKDAGWLLKREWYNVESGQFPHVEEIYIPDEVLEDIISKHTQKKLSE